MKGYELWNPANGNAVYSRDVIFREGGSTSKAEEVKRIKELENLELDLSKESHDSDGSTESEEEVEIQNPVARRSKQARKKHERYSPPEFRSSFSLSTT